MPAAVAVGAGRPTGHASRRRKSARSAGLPMIHRSPEPGGPQQTESPPASMVATVGPSADALAQFFELQLAQAADEKEAAMSFAEEQLSRLSGMLQEIQKECGRLKARSEKLEEDNAELKKITQRSVRELDQEKVRVHNLAQQHRTVAKERRALHRQVADTERYALNHGRRWQERAVDLEHAELALRQSLAEQQAVASVTSTARQEHQQLRARAEVLEAELARERELARETQHGRLQAQKARERMEREVEMLRRELAAEQKITQQLKRDVPGKIRLALEEEREEKAAAVSRAQRETKQAQTEALGLRKKCEVLSGEGLGAISVAVALQVLQSMGSSDSATLSWHELREALAPATTPDAVAVDVGVCGSEDDSTDD